MRHYVPACSCIMDTASSRVASSPPPIPAVGSTADERAKASPSPRHRAATPQLLASPPVTKNATPREVTIKLEHLAADTRHRGRVAVAMHRHFNPPAATPLPGVGERPNAGAVGRATPDKDDDSTANNRAPVVRGVIAEAAATKVRGGDDGGSGLSAGVAGDGAGSRRGTMGAVADGGGIGGGGARAHPPPLPASGQRLEVPLAIPGFRFFEPAQVAEVVAQTACVGMAPHRQVTLTRAIFLAADQEDITGQLVLDSRAEDVMKALLSTSRRTWRGTIPFGTRVRVLRFLRAMR